MKGKRLLVSLFVTTALVLGLTLPAAAQVEPPEVIEELAPGDSIEITKTVTTPIIPPKPDIYFLSDITGSMAPSIGVVQANAGTILAAISGVDPNAQFGVGSYRDYPYDVPPPFYHQQAITDDTGAVSAAIGAWAAGGGGDGPESQLYALTMLATDPAIGWRDGASKIVVWFGDAPGHDPIPNAATGLGYDIDEASATAALVAAGIRVIAVSVTTGYPNGLDDDPTLGGGNYAAAYGIVEDGNPQQATRIAAATGGVALIGVPPEAVVEAILAGLEAVRTDVWGVIEADKGLSVTLEPTVHYNIESGTSVIFTETITVADNAPQCKTLTATVIFYANKYPDEGAVIGKQIIRIKVKDITPPEVWCVEGVNPHGKNIPPAGKTTMPGPKGGQNDEGFYELLAEDNHDDPEMIRIWIVYRFSEEPLDRVVFPEDPFNNPGAQSFSSGDVIKLTESPGAAPSMKKMGSSKGQADAVVAHIKVPKDTAPTPDDPTGLILVARDTAGNWIVCRDCCFVPPPPK